MYSDNLSSKNFYYISKLSRPNYSSNYSSLKLLVDKLSYIRSKKIREERSHKFFKAKISKAFKKSSVISLSNGRTLRGVSSVEAGEWIFPGA